MTTPHEAPVTPLHRHQLVRLGDDGWRRVLERPWDAGAQACLAHWAARRLPLVVTRQAPGLSCHAEGAGELALGLAAPLAWARRRIALMVARRDVAGFDEFPRAEALAPALPKAGREAWRRLCATLAALGAPTRVYGSHGWQLLSGLRCVHAHSDVDLWAAVGDAPHADAVAALLEGFAAAGVPRLDGELLFADGRAVAWREWRAWRAGRCRAVMTKTLAGAALVHAAAGFDAVPS